MNSLTPQQQRSIKIAIGIATIIFVFWFVRESQIVTEAIRPKAEAGKLGNPAVAGAFAMLAEILVAIGGAVFVVLTGLWKWGVDLVAPWLSQSEADSGTLTGEELIQKALAENRLSPERQAQLEQALFVAIEIKDHRGVIKLAELLAGQEFFPRAAKAGQ